MAFGSREKDASRHSPPKPPIEYIEKPIQRWKVNVEEKRAGNTPARNTRSGAKRVHPTHGFGIKKGPGRNPRPEIRLKADS
jgi:hypothetical protein